MDFGAKLELLRRTPYLRSLPAPELRALGTRLRERDYRDGDVIFHRGDASEGLGVVLRGRVADRDHLARGARTGSEDVRAWTHVR